MGFNNNYGPENNDNNNNNTIAPPEGIGSFGRNLKNAESSPMLYKFEKHIARSNRNASKYNAQWSSMALRNVIRSNVPLIGSENRFNKMVFML